MTRTTFAIPILIPSLLALLSTPVSCATEDDAPHAVGIGAGLADDFPFYTTGL